MYYGSFTITVEADSEELRNIKMNQLNDLLEKVNKIMIGDIDGFVDTEELWGEDEEDESDQCNNN